MQITLTQVDNLNVTPNGSITCELTFQTEPEDLITGLNGSQEIDEVLEGLCEDDDNVKTLLNKIGKDKVVEHFEIEEAE